jgi:hypothetical protein
MRRCALAICLAALAACASTDNGPTEPGGATGNGPRTVVESLTGIPISGATVSFTQSGAAKTVTTASDGSWDAGGQVDGAIEVSAPGFVTRRTYLNLVQSQGIDLIRDAAPFSLVFYRQLLRNNFDEPGSLQALRRWTKNPNFYIDVRNPRAGGDLSASERDAIGSIVRAVVPEMTGGRLSAGSIEFGSGARGDRSGVVSVGFVDEGGNQFCGWSRVGTDPGSITINLASRCDTPCGVIAPRILAHEVGHALGFYHVERGDVLSTNWAHRECGNTTLSSVEQHHARLAYSRRPGNKDTDTDPVLSLFIENGGAPPLIGCR